MADEERLLVHCSAEVSQRLTAPLRDLGLNVRTTKIHGLEGLAGDGVIVMAVAAATVLPRIVELLKTVLVSRVKYGNIELINPTREQLEVLVKQVADRTQVVRTATLGDLLLQLFTVEELRLFVRRFGDAEEIEASLAWQAPAATVTSDLVEVLRRRGRIDAGFFESLRGVRPHRVAEIDAVRTQVLP